jgi:hypothetical protein
LEDKDADLRENLAALGPGALADLRRVLQRPQTYRDALLRQFMARPQLADLATLIAMADTDEVVRLLRVIRDVGDQGDERIRLADQVADTDRGRTRRTATTATGHKRTPATNHPTTSPLARPL